jgi:hypothetical protein
MISLRTPDFGESTNLGATSLRRSTLHSTDYPSLGQFTDEDRLPRTRDLISAILKHPEIERVLESLSDEKSMRRFIEVLLRSNTSCQDLLVDRVLQSEFLFESFGELSSEERASLAKETELLGAFHQEIVRAGFVPEWLDLAQRISREARLPSEETSFSYDIIRSLQLLADDARWVTELFATYADSSVSPATLASYSLESILCSTEQSSYPGRLSSLSYKTFPEPKSPSGQKSFWIWMDAPFGLFIKRDGIPQAILSFSPRGRFGALQIEQMQGVAGFGCTDTGYPLNIKHPQKFTNNLFGISFRDLFVSAVEKIAEMNGCEKVIITGGENNIWIRPNKWKSVPTYSIEAARKGYDDVAKRRLYRQRDDGDWEHTLGSSER